MKIILLQDVENLGKAGEVKDVKPGYFKNYLYRKNLAIIYTKEKLKEQEEIIERKRLKQEKRIKKLQEALASLGKIEIKKKIGPEGRLFGAVTTADIQEALKKENIEIEQHSILLEREIHHAGEYKIDIKLSPQIITSLDLAIIQEK
jgi:large subunit ribosomal protein L9